MTNLFYVPNELKKGRIIYNENRMEEIIYNIISSQEIKDSKYIETVRIVGDGNKRFHRTYVFSEETKDLKLIKQGFEDVVLGIRYESPVAQEISDKKRISGLIKTITLN